MSRVEHHDELARRAKVRKERRLDRHRRELANANFSSAIYGEILVLSVLGALDVARVDAAVVLETVVASQLVFWLAHAYSETIDQQLRARRDDGNGIGWRGVVRVMEHEWPMVQAAIPAAVLMVLALVGVLRTRTAIDLSLGLAVVSLFGWGVASARRGGRPFVAQLIVGAISGAFGLGIVGLKLLVH